MHTEELVLRSHSHNFNMTNPTAERSTLIVMWITASMMVIEIFAGWWYNSMALMADGWHMSSHAIAIGISAFAYRAARRFSDDSRFAFGTWKIEVLGAFASAIVLIGVAAMMVIGSVERIIFPQTIKFADAITVALVGLCVNLVCAVILGQKHNHYHHHDGHHNHCDRSDLNLKSAYLHVLADAATSVLAIIALAGGWFYEWLWLDPAMGIIGAGLVAAWGKNMLFEAGKVLLDCEMDNPVVDKIQRIVEMELAGWNRVLDIHVWRVSKNSFACVISLITHERSLNADIVRELLSGHSEIAHSTIEIKLGN